MPPYNWITPLILFLVVLPVTAQVEGLGTTSFENSGSAQAQDAFLRGVLLLHSFEYEDAHEAFLEAQRIDHDFAMAYWGQAMTWNHPIWMDQDTEAGRTALLELGADMESRLKKAPTEREKDYLRAVESLYFGEGDKKARDLAYERQMAAMSAEYPEDLDAAAFHALSVLGIAHEGRDSTLYMRAAAIAEDVIAANPYHPGALHYLIHAYDDPVHAPRGMYAAEMYAKIAPEAVHALHMPSHIFTALGMWPEASASNEASLAASIARMRRKELDVNAKSFHARHWLVYAYLQQGRYAEAEQLVQDMIGDMREGGDQVLTRSYAVMIVAAYLTETGQWESEYAHMDFAPKETTPMIESTIFYIRGKAALEAGDEGEARKALMAIMNIEDEEHVSELLQHQLKADLLALEGNLDGALDLLRLAVETDAARPLDFGPPVPAKPTSELLGEYYLKAEKWTEARNAFENALANAPGRSLSFLGLSVAAKMEHQEDVYHIALSRLKENWLEADPNVVELLRDGQGPFGTETSRARE